MEENNEETKGVCVACGAADVSVNKEGKCENCAAMSGGEHGSENESEGNEKKE